MEVGHKVPQLDILPRFFDRIAFSLELVLFLVLWLMSLLVELPRICVVLRKGFLAPSVKTGF